MSRNNEQGPDDISIQRVYSQWAAEDQDFMKGLAHGVDHSSDTREGAIAEALELEARAREQGGNPAEFTSLRQAPDNAPRTPLPPYGDEYKLFFERRGL